MSRSEIEFLTFLMIEKVIEQKQLEGIYSKHKRAGWDIHSTLAETKGAVIRADYLFYLTNHDRTHTSLWGCRFEQWLCATIGLRSFTSPLRLE